MHRANHILLVILSLLLLGGCSSTHGVTEDAVANKQDDSHPIRLTRPASHSTFSERIDALSRYFEEWKGTPYRYGGKSKNGIDCSAFTQLAYQQLFSHPLPRTTRLQLTEGNKISLNTVDHGDLVFFKTGSQRYHVGIYVGEKQFMHASSSKGVIISRLDNPYWSARLLQVRRYPLK